MSRFACVLLALFLFTTQALAQGFVSIKGTVVNVRERPTTRSEVQWELTDGYPLRVTARRNGWVRVRDFEGHLGWVSGRLVDQRPHHVVRARIANLRERPTTRSRVVGKVERYELLRTVAKRSGWVQVERAGGQRGWISRKLVWGW